MTYFGGTNRTRKLCYKSLISNNLIEMRSLIIPRYLRLWLTNSCSFAFIIYYSTLAFTPWENSNYVVVSVSIDFSSYSKRNPFFHRTCYDIWLRWTSWSFKRFTIVGYPDPPCFGCCCWILWMGPDWNWCIYISF